MAEGGEVEVRTQTADCGVTRAAREGGGVRKEAGDAVQQVAASTP